MADQPIRQYPDELRERAEADTDAIANPPIVGLAAPVCPEHQAGAVCPCPPGCYCCQPEPAPAATEATDPATITDPAWLRQQYAAALREHGMVHLGDQVPADEYDCCADAVLAVRDRHLLQLRQRLTLADADLDRYEEHVVGDLNEANIALARQAARAEQQRDQLADDLRYALDDHGPRHAHKQPGTWDDSGAPCAHCIRLEQARQHLANLKPAEA